MLPASSNPQQLVFVSEMRAFPDGGDGSDLVMTGREICGRGASNVWNRNTHWIV